MRDQAAWAAPIPTEIQQSWRHNHLRQHDRQPMGIRGRCEAGAHELGTDDDAFVAGVEKIRLGLEHIG